MSNPEIRFDVSRDEEDQMDQAAIGLGRLAAGDLAADAVYTVALDCTERNGSQCGLAIEMTENFDGADLVSTSVCVGCQAGCPEPGNVQRAVDTIRSFAAATSPVSTKSL